MRPPAERPLATSIFALLIALSFGLLVLPASARQPDSNAGLKRSGAEAGVSSPVAHTSARRCFGKPARSLNRRGRHRIGRWEAVIVNAPVTIIAKGDNRICTGRAGHPANINLGKGSRNFIKLGSGDDTIRITGPAGVNRIDAGGGNNRVFVNSKARKQVIKTGSGNDRVVARAKATAYSISTGAGNDSIVIRPPAKASSRRIATGLGEDTVVVRAKGNTHAFLGARKNPKGLTDNDYYSGGHSNDIVEVYGGINYIYGGNGADEISSLGSARSHIYGGNGSDKLYSNGGDRIFGGRGNDRIEANRGTSIDGVFADGGAGDDWVYGTDKDDILLGSTGVDKFKGFGGNDLFRADDGVNTVDGGSGLNTISFAAHTPPGYQKRSGIFVDLRQGVARGSANTTLTNVQNVIGSSFDDIIRTDPRQPSEVWGGLGNDEIVSHSHDTVHPGLIDEECVVRRQQTFCPPRPAPGQPIISLSPDGVLTVMGTAGDDRFNLGRNPGGAFTVSAGNTPWVVGETCTVSGNRAECRAPELLNILAYGGAGNDTITVEDSMPAGISTVLDGGHGNNVIRGGKTSDYIYAGRGNSVLEGGAGNDVIRTSETHATVVRAGSGHDLIRIPNACAGHQVSGGPGKDNAVFAGSPRGVEINYTRNYARWLGASNCNPTRVADDIESAEGTRHDDVFIGSRKRGVSFLGREGNDVFRIRNGRRDAITTGPGGRGNKVIADRFDKVTYGWGFAAY